MEYQRDKQFNIILDPAGIRLVTEMLVMPKKNDIYNFAKVLVF